MIPEAETTVIEKGPRVAPANVPLLRRIIREHTPNELIIMLIAGATVFAAIIAYWHVRADSLALRYSREAQAQALTALRDDVQANMAYVFESGLMRSHLGLRALSELALLQGDSGSANRLQAAARALLDQGALLQPPYYNGGDDGLAPDQYNYWYDGVYRPYLLASERRAGLAAMARALSW
jgi:hypothetical protein